MTGKDVLDYLSQPNARWIMAGVVVVAALGLGGLMLAGGGDEARAAGAPGLSVAVVAPVEPDVAPGGVMDVGQLNNGFDGKLPEAQAASDTQPPDDYYAEQPAYVEPRVQPMPPPRAGEEVHPYIDRESAPPPPVRPAPRPEPASSPGLFY